MLRIYGNYLSQPSRAVLWLLHIHNEPFELVRISPAAGACDTDEFLSKFPMGTIPAMERGPLRISEAHAIMPYLCETFGWGEWYPLGNDDADVAKRAQVQQWLHWHHSNARNITRKLMFPLRAKAVADQGCTPARFFQDAHLKKEKLWQSGVEDCQEIFRVMVSNALMTGQPYLVPGDVPTVCDLSLYCELEQLLWFRTENGQLLVDVGNEPLVLHWMERMKTVASHDSIRRELNEFMAATIS